MINMQQLMQQAQNMQKKLQASQEQLKNTIFEGDAGNGNVKIAMDGSYQMKKIEINSSMLDADNKEMLEDLIMVAFNNCKDKIDTESKNALGDLGAGAGMLNGLF